jgi:hypothetical protein
MINLEQNNHKDIQLDINFEDDFNRAEELINDLNAKYPNAKLLVKYLGDKIYLVGVDKKMKEGDLESEFILFDKAYAPDEKESWYNK